VEPQEPALALDAAEASRSAPWRDRPPSRCQRRC
jgi:hypothetical protein